MGLWLRKQVIVSKATVMRDSEEGFVAPCWCGEKCAWFSFDTESHCCGTGSLSCLCGGDFCVCHNHGETECPGCSDCEFWDWEDGDDYF